VGGVRGGIHCRIVVGTGALGTEGDDREAAACADESLFHATEGNTSAYKRIVAVVVREDVAKSVLHTQRRNRSLGVMDVTG
jgi:hypothetical protein